MMRESRAEIIRNTKIAEQIHEMELRLPEQTEEIRAGQFIELKIEAFYLRRPVSVCDREGDRITIIYKEAGRGTEAMAGLQAGQTMSVLWPLGNGYQLPESGAGSRPLLIGGGVGVPPVYCLCRRMLEQGIVPQVILGFRSAADAFCVERFEEIGVRPAVTTEDGSLGQKGFVTDVMKRMEYDRFYACGPKAMLKAVDETAPEGIPGQFSFEERMGCGFGACMGCTCRTKNGAKRICKDGPVLERSEILW